MRFAVSEFNDLVLDRRTIARPDPFDRSGVYSGFRKVLANDPMGLVSSAGNCARDLSHRNSVSQEREGNWIFIGLLFAQDAPVYAFPIQPGRCAGFQAGQSKS